MRIHQGVRVNLAERTGDEVSLGVLRGKAQLAGPDAALLTRDTDPLRAIWRLSHDVLVQVASERVMSIFWMSEVPS